MIEPLANEVLAAAPKRLAGEYKICFNALVKALKEYGDNPSAAAKRNWDVAAAALAEKEGEITGGGGGGAWPGNTKNRSAVLRYLHDGGWEIGKSQFNEHCRRGRLAPGGDGLYTRRIVDEYARTFLKRAETGMTVEAGETALAVEKTREEIERIRVIREREQFRLDCERAKFLPRAEIEQELAARAIVLQAGFMHFARTSARELIASFGGDLAREGDFVTQMEEMFNSYLNQYATTEEFQVIVVGESDTATTIDSGQEVV